MKLLSNESLKGKINNNDLERGKFIHPLLDFDQVGSICVDLRLDVFFYVPIKTVNPTINLLSKEQSIEKFFQNTYRNIGQKFIIYPNQYILANTLEYIRLPKNVHAELTLRSSYKRLGLHMYSIIQPGYAGTMTLDLKNTGDNPVELIVGSRIAQIKFFCDEENDENYSTYSNAKYVCNIEPQLSKSFKDKDLKTLEKISMLYS